MTVDAPAPPYTTPEKPYESHTKPPVVDGVPMDYGPPASPAVIYVDRRDLRRQRRALRRAGLCTYPVVAPPPGAPLVVVTDRPRGVVGEAFTMVGQLIALPFRIVNAALRAVF